MQLLRPSGLDLVVKTSDFTVNCRDRMARLTKRCVKMKGHVLGNFCRSSYISGTRYICLQETLVKIETVVKIIFGSNSLLVKWGYLHSSVGKESTCNVGDLGSIPVLGRSPGEGKGYPLQYSGLENSMDCIVHGVTKSHTQLNGFHFWLVFMNFLLGKKDTKVRSYDRNRVQETSRRWRGVRQCCAVLLLELGLGIFAVQGKGWQDN